MTMLHDPARHEPCSSTPWSEARARGAIEHIVRDTEARFTPGHGWPLHPRDDECDTVPGQAYHPLYFGTCGVIWALHRLQALGAVRLARSYAGELEALIPLNRAWLGSDEAGQFASYLMGDTGILMVSHALDPRPDTADRLQAAIAGNLDNPTRELMWGAPGTMLAALFLHEHDGQPRWADLYRRSARRLWEQMVWSEAHQCHHWTQDMYGSCTTYLDAVHGFVATALVLIRGRHLLDAGTWPAWQARIETTVRRSVSLAHGLANWRVLLDTPPGSTPRMLMQFCHGAPGFVTCLADMPGTALDDLLLAAGEATWQAGPLTKGSNLCHGAAGNGYAFLDLHARTQDPRWLDRARAFAMHGIEQTEAEAAALGRMRYSLWTGDPGLAIYLWDCIHGSAGFPTLKTFF